MNELELIRQAASKTSPQDRAYIMLTNDVSSAIVEAMEAKGWNQATLAKELGKDKSYVSRVLSGENITLRTIAEFEVALKTKLVFTQRSISVRYSSPDQSVYLKRKSTIRLSMGREVAMHTEVSVESREFEEVLVNTK